MELIQSMRQAIDYMEEHMLDGIGYEDVAKHLYMSNYHFHRLFSMLTGMSPREYMRNRRLSMAAQELSVSEARIIDLALKYGYETPDGFTKAFTRFHGITPNQVKKSGVQLKNFGRLTIKLTMEGGRPMDYRIVEKAPFQLLAKVESFRNETVSDDSNEIPQFWDRCGGDGTFDLLHQYSTGKDIYGICAPISRESDYFEYGIGMKYEGGTVPAGFRVWTVKPTLWAVFKCIGRDGNCIGEMWDRIFHEFLPCYAYNMLDDVDFELYPGDETADYFCEIWIPVEKKLQQ